MRVIKFPNDDNGDFFDDEVNIPTINRAVITISRLQPYFDWCNSLEESTDDPYSQENDEEFEAYLVSDDYDDHEELIKAHFDTIFELELFAWCTNRNAWPKQRTYAVFKKWFKARAISVVFDLTDDLPLEHDIF